MKTKEKGYSLNVLVITIAVMLILTSTAIVSMRSLTKDKAITEFMNDIQEVEEFVLAYYSSKNILPIVYEDGVANPIDVPEDMQGQIDPKDKGEYYEVDLTKLGAIKLFDDDRGGYVLNENTLNIYVLKPVEYEGVKYYTLTDEILGIEKVYGAVQDFEVDIIGNPIVWTKKFNMLVSIPEEANVNGKWTFKYYKDGPISAKQFTNMGTFFEYGNPIEISENGIHSIYVENEEGQAKVVNVVVNKIDEINPSVYRSDTNEIVVIDNETGIAKIHYKIMAYDSISDTERATNIETYMQGPKGALPNATGGGILTYEEAYTGERVNGVDEPHIGRSINTYKSEYEEYLARYEAELLNPSGDLKNLDDEFPQFQFNGMRYSDDEVNIVLYVEDYAGNYSVTNKDNELCVVSRKMLMDSHFIETVIQPLAGVQVTINKGDKYTSDRKVDLDIKAQGASDMAMYITCDPDYVPEVTDWVDLEKEITDFELEGPDGEIEVFVFVTANQMENGVLKYERVSSKIFLDTIPPTDTSPEVDEIGNDLTLYVESMQEDKESGIAFVEYGYKLKDDANYTWRSSLNGVVVEENKEYQIKTRATDNAGNVTESKVTEIKSPLHRARTLPNVPAMATGMTAIVWDGTLDIPTEEIEINHNTWKTKDGEEVTWYNYEIGDNVNDKRENIWANAKTADGSYWVWIPRYAYKITYYEDTAKTIVKGYYQNSTAKGMHYYQSDGITVASNPDDVKTTNVMIDIIFLDGVSSTQYKEENIETNAITIKQLPEEYIVHPAFTGANTSTISNSLGKWSTDVTGIWVAKFEASRADSKIDEQGVSTTIKSVPSVKSFTNVKVGDAYKYSELMFPGLYSHLMKNSEWGAVAYLTYSAYGRNGHEPAGNRNSGFVTGGGGAGTSAYTATASKFEGSYAYDVRASISTSGMYASTTGNIYGIYDLVGGASEFVATYVANSDECIQTNAEKMTQTTTPSLREVYSVADTDAAINNYNRNGLQDAIYGNAIYETSTGYLGNYGVESDTTNFPATTKPFFTRGGSAKDGSGAGLFNFDQSDGAANEETGFRPVLTFR
ncbi:MAG: hypothetical protein IJX99_07545 [Clostridia bacterium]|nr:hypothetical protein [Clostridia bacterium]